MRSEATYRVASAYSCKGAVYIELALSLGLLILLILGGIDLGMMIDSRSVLSGLTRQTASVAFRRSCAKQADPTQCLQEVRAESMQYAQTMGLANHSLPGPLLRDANFEVILSIYSCGTYTCSGDCAPTSLAEPTSCSCTCGNVQLSAIAPDLSDADSNLHPVFPSQFNVSEITTTMMASMHQHSQLTISEIIFRNQGITKFTDRDLLHEESIY